MVKEPNANIELINLNNEENNLNNEVINLNKGIYQNSDGIMNTNNTKTDNILGVSNQISSITLLEDGLINEKTINNGTLECQFSQGCLNKMMAFLVAGIEEFLFRIDVKDEFMQKMTELDYSNNLD